MISTRRKTQRGVVHEMADLGVDYLCGQRAGEPFNWTDDPVTCQRCLHRMDEQAKLLWEATYG